MPNWLEITLTALLGLTMVVGLVGLLVPLFPGLLVMWLAALGYGEQVARSGSNEVIEMLERGEITPEEAEKMLRGEKD